jgi:phospholipase/lecithinase/hemolysin
MKSIDRIRSLGARNFVILNMPPIFRSPKYNLPHEPGILSHELIKDSVETYNGELARLVAAYKDEHVDTNLMLFDLHSYWTLILDYPEIFGMTDCERYQMLLDGQSPNLGRAGFW